MDKQMRRYYVAVSQKEFKLVTLMELLVALHGDSSTDRVQGNLTVVICCSSRDSLDEAARGVLNAAQLFSISVLHSDMTEREREAELVRAKGGITASDTPNVEATRSGMSPSAVGDRPAGANPIDASRGLFHPPYSSRSQPVVLITTDPPLKAASKELLPLGASLLIQYDLPLHKEVFLRRMAAAFGSGKERRSTTGRNLNTVIDFITAAEIVAFRRSEEWASVPIMEMPVPVADIFR